MQIRRTALALAIPVLSLGQTPEKVVDEYLRAVGGVKAVAQVRDINIAGNLTEETTGKTGSFSLIMHAPNRYYLEVLAGPDRMVEAYNGSSAWGQDAEGLHTMTGAPAREIEATGRLWNGRLVEVK